MGRDFFKSIARRSTTFFKHKDCDLRSSFGPYDFEKLKRLVCSIYPDEVIIPARSTRRENKESYTAYSAVNAFIVFKIGKPEPIGISTLSFYKVKIENSFAEFLDENKFKLIFKIDAGEKYFFNQLKRIKLI